MFLRDIRIFKFDELRALCTSFNTQPISNSNHHAKPRQAKQRFVFLKAKAPPSHEYLMELEKTAILHTVQEMESEQPFYYHKDEIMQTDDNYYYAVKKPLPENLRGFFKCTHLFIVLIARAPIPDESDGKDPKSYLFHNAFTIATFSALNEYSDATLADMVANPVPFSTNPVMLDLSVIRPKAQLSEVELAILDNALFLRDVKIFKFNEAFTQCSPFKMQPTSSDKLKAKQRFGFLKAKEEPAIEHSKQLEQENLKSWLEGIKPDQPHYYREEDKTQMDNNHYYALKRTLPDNLRAYFNCTHLIIVLIAKVPIPDELIGKNPKSYLFHNAFTIATLNKYSDVKLADMVADPLMFSINPVMIDLSIIKTKAQLTELELVMLANIEVMLKRGEELKKLIKSTKAMLDSCNEFNRLAAGVNPETQGCCGATKTVATSVAKSASGLVYRQ